MNYRLKYFTLVAVSLLLLPSFPGRGNPTPTNHLISQTPTLVGEMSVDKLFQEGVQQFRVEVIQRNSTTFEQLPKRWIVERTFGWLNRFRRLSKDYELYSELSEAMIYSSLIRLMIRRMAS